MHYSSLYILFNQILSRKDFKTKNLESDNLDKLFEQFFDFKLNSINQQKFKDFLVFDIEYFMKFKKNDFEEFLDQTSEYLDNNIESTRDQSSWILLVVGTEKSIPQTKHQKSIINYL